MSYINVSKKDLKRNFKRARLLYILLAFPILWYILFCYVPMFGVGIAFKNYSLFRGFAASPWVGFKHFIEFLPDSYFWHVFRNTLFLGFFNTLINFPIPIILALLFNEMKYGMFKKITQTVSYLPHFVSTVALVNIVTVMLSPSMGVINHVIQSFGIEPINFLIQDEWFRPIYILTIMWRDAGWGTIIYLAAMANIDPELYNVADIDGAGRLMKILHITIPSIISTIIIMLMLSMPGIIGNDFETVLLLQMPITYNTSDVIGTFIYRRGLIDSRFDYATAIGLMFSVLSMGIIYISNKMGRKFGGISIW